MEANECGRGIEQGKRGKMFGSRAQRTIWEGRNSRHDGTDQRRKRAHFARSKKRVDDAASAEWKKENKEMKMDAGSWRARWWTAEQVRGRKKREKRGRKEGGAGGRTRGVVK